MYRHIFYNTRMREAQVHTYHWMDLAVIQGKGALRNCRYVQGRKQWMIVPQTVRPHSEGEAVFVTLKGEVDRTQFSLVCPVETSVYTLVSSDLR